MTWKTIVLIGLSSAITACNNPPPKPPDSVLAITGDTVAYIGEGHRGNFQVRSIFRDAKNHLWFATNGSGVFEYDGTTIKKYTTKHGLCSDFVWSIQQSAGGNLWFKTRDGISRFDGLMFTTIKISDTLHSADANKWQSAPGDIWIPADNKSGVYRYNGSSYSLLQLPKVNSDSTYTQSPSNNYSPYAVYCILKDRNGNVWFGTQERGVCRYDGRSFTWLTGHGLDSAAVRCIFEDRNGTIWIGNNGLGLFRYDGKTLTNFTEEKKLKNPGFLKYMKGENGPLACVWTITDDKQGNLWIGTIDAGVWMYDGEKMTNYTTKEGLGINSIWTIYRDKNDDILFGTDGAGVYTFDGHSFNKLTAPQR